LQDNETALYSGHPPGFLIKYNIKNLCRRNLFIRKKKCMFASELLMNENMNSLISISPVLYIFNGQNLDGNRYLLERERERERDSNLASRARNIQKNQFNSKIPFVCFFTFFEYFFLQLAGVSLLFTGKPAQFPGESLRLGGKSLQVNGVSPQVRGESGQLSGTSPQPGGKPGQVRGVSRQLEGNPRKCNDQSNYSQTLNI
jgi:hypothetical protein